MLLYNEQKIQQQLTWLTNQIKCLKDHDCECASAIVQNNFVRTLIINEEDLSGTGTIEEQICEYILTLPIGDRTILEIDSKWNIIILESDSEERIFDNTFDYTFN